MRDVTSSKSSKENIDESDKVMSGKADTDIQASNSALNPYFNGSSFVPKTNATIEITGHEMLTIYVFLCFWSN